MIFTTSKHHFPCLPALLFLAAISNGLFAQVLYIGNTGDGTISSYVIDQDNGLLTELLPRIATTGTPTSLVIHPNNKFVYVTNSGNPNVNGPSIAIFSINPGTGALSRLNSVPLTGGSGPTGAAIDPAGKFLFIANGAGSVSVFGIDASGALSPVTGSPFAAPAGPTKVVVHPNGKFAYVSAGTAGQIAVFSIGATGALTPITGSPFAARNNLVWMAMDKDGKFLFAAERQDQAVLVYSVNANTGALTQVGSPFPSQGGILGVTADPAGLYLFASNSGAGSLTTYLVGPTGALAPASGQSIPAIAGAADAIVDPSGKFLYVTGQGANAIASFAIDRGPAARAPNRLPQFVPTGPGPMRGATTLLNPPVVPPIIAESAYNYHSHSPAGMPNAGIAQGSRIAISGKNIGPVSFQVGGSPYPRQTDLGGVSVQIRSGDVTTAGLMVFVTNSLVTAIVPSTTPLGDATVTVTYKGRTTAPLPITIVAQTLGIRTWNEFGSGPARARNADPDTQLNANTDLSKLPLNSLAQSAKPGQFMVIQAMGLGAVDADETQDFVQSLDNPADVIVGNKTATVITKARAADGSDFILIKLPDDVPQGCYVPLAVRTGGITSNVVTISIDTAGGSCSDPAGLSASDIDAAQKSGQIRLGTILLDHLDFGLAGTQDSVAAGFPRYDFNSLTSAFSWAPNGEGIRSLASTPAFGTCSISASPSRPNHAFDLEPDPIHPQWLNAGPALNLNGPAGAARIGPDGPTYSFHPDQPFVAAGDYTVDNGAGTPQVGSFKSVLSLPQPITWTNEPDLGAPLDRAQDLTVTWTGGDPDKEFALIAGLSNNGQAIAGFLCAEKVSAGKFTIPAWVLSSLPASAIVTDGGVPLPGGALAVGAAPLASVGRFSAPGLDFGVFTYEQGFVSLVSFQ